LPPYIGQSANAETIVNAAAKNRRIKFHRKGGRSRELQALTAGTLGGILINSGLEKVAAQSIKPS
jgi:hypothetical protein